MMNVPNRRQILAAASAGFVFLLGARAGAQDPPRTITEKIKTKAGNAVDSLKRGAVSAEEAIKNQFERARAGVSKMGIEARVYARIHWDKALLDNKIDLSAPREGVIAASGSVPDEKARAKAIELIRDTVGVTQVIDNLVVRSTTIEGSSPAPVPVKP